MSETENILQTIKTTVQDLVAPDVRELKVRLASLQDQNKVQFAALQSQLESMKSQFEAMNSKIASIGQQSDAQFKALLAAIGQGKAESELSNFRAIAALSEPVAALEAARQ